MNARYSRQVPPRHATSGQRHSFASPFQEFFQKEAATGFLLLVSAAGALAAANSPFADAYFRLLNTPMTIALGSSAVSLTLHQWVNGGLMTLFFLLIGLEIKHEVLVGELA